MQRFKEHIFLKVISVILVASLITPAAVKIWHIFASHEHIICISYQTEHYHELDVDCDFNKFNTVKKYLANNTYQDNGFSDYGNKEIFSNYFLIKDHQQLSFSLRAPPYALI